MFGDENTKLTCEKCPGLNPRALSFQAFIKTVVSSDGIADRHALPRSYLGLLLDHRVVSGTKAE